jgi:hypothetical protein
MVTMPQGNPCNPAARTKAEHDSRIRPKAVRCRGEMTRWRSPCSTCLGERNPILCQFNKNLLRAAKRMAILREPIRAESVHDMDALIGGMTSDCFNDVVGRVRTVRWADADRLTLSRALVGLSRLHRASAPHPMRGRIERCHRK